MNFFPANPAHAVFIVFREFVPKFRDIQSYNYITV